jgi:hypothetical protein
MTKTTIIIRGPAAHLATAYDIATYLEAALQDGVRKSVQIVQILDAFSSAPAGGGDQPGSPGCWGSPAGSP